MTESEDITLANTLIEGADDPSAAAALAQVYGPGAIVGGTYKLKKLIGKGGMGYVFCAEHTIIGQDYALKILAPEQINETNWRRFHSEGKAIARLNHTNIVRIHNMGVDRDQCPYYVMDLLYGVSLAEVLLKAGPVKPVVTIEIFLQICRGLAYAHQLGVVHRDVKPSNIILRGQEAEAIDENERVPEIKIVDFGIAKLIRIEGDSLQHITNTGEIFGTPLYMSPEQCMGNDVDARSDIYSLGCTLYETLTGEPPFRGQSAMETVLMHMENEPPHLSEMLPESHFAQSMDLLVTKMLKKDPLLRHQNMAQVIHDLERIKEGKIVVQPVLVQSSASLARVGDRLVTEKNNHNNLEGEREKENSNPAQIALVVAGLSAVVALCGWLVSLAGYSASAPPASPSLKAAPINLDNFNQEEAKLRKAFAGINTFSLGTTGSGKTRKRYFQFSANESVGLLHSYQAQIVQPARGRVSMPADEPLYLELETKNGYAVELMPDLLAKFGNDDIAGLIVKSDEWPAMLAQMHRWHNLRRVEFHKINITDQHVKDIDALPYLRSMRLDHCEFEASALSRLRVLRQLRSLDVDSKFSIAEVIRAVAGSKNLEVFCMDGTSCTAQDLFYLAQCPNLKELHLKANALVARDLSVFTKMPALSFLDLRDATFSPSASEYFRRLPKLEVLSLPGLAWSNADKARLRKDIPAYTKSPQ